MLARFCCNVFGTLPAIEANRSGTILNGFAVAIGECCQSKDWNLHTYICSQNVHKYIYISIKVLRVCEIRKQQNCIQQDFVGKSPKCSFNMNLALFFSYSPFVLGNNASATKVKTENASKFYYDSVHESIFFVLVLFTHMH